jgi:hypothetical protein
MVDAVGIVMGPIVCHDMAARLRRSLKAIVTTTA